MLKTIDFHYDLPKDLIASFPLERRDASRMLHLPLDSTQPFENKKITDIVSLLLPGDILICNDTRVIPARLFCHRSTGAAIELLFTQRIDSLAWYAIGRPMRRLTPGTTLIVDATPGVELEVAAGPTGDTRTISLKNNTIYATLDELLEQVGVVPLPPYLEREAQECDRERYQTVYARNPGAVAAPTAGLHFTPELLQSIEKKGVKVEYVTLHVGVGTFRPVSEDDPAQHPMHTERYTLPAQTVSAIEAAKRSGGRVIAVGTTVVRVLESCASGGKLRPGDGATNLFILPPFRFSVVDGLLTNFHLPCSTLLMLVCAFSSRERVLEAYRFAVANQYRFFSYGDAMLLL